MGTYCLFFLAHRLRRRRRQSAHFTVASINPCSFYGFAQSIAWALKQTESLHTRLCAV